MSAVRSGLATARCGADVDARRRLSPAGQPRPRRHEAGFDVYAGDQLGIRIVADRGQWFVEVHPGADGVSAVGWEGWFTLEAWSACLGEPVVFHDTRPTLTDED